ncbi:histidinol dehydrogenase [bacterium]|nr:histidinol dehydrogenase [bacterium]
MKFNSTEKISQEKLLRIFSRPASDSKKIMKTVKPIVEDVKQNGLRAALKYATKFDGFEGENLLVSKMELDKAERLLDVDSKKAMMIAAKNIEKFHSKQYPSDYSIETMPGVKCSREFRPIENVGLYVPGGTAVLPSTLLMLGIPALLAGCKRVTAISPTQNVISNAVLFAAKLCGVKEFYKIGGAHGIALLAYGDKSLKKVDKIFGPGNQYVTAAKSLVSIDTEGCAIDMPAGPSEVLIIADDYANPTYIAADILSQAEHGKDSQAILLTTNGKIVTEVQKEIARQKKYLLRTEFIEGALAHSSVLLVRSIDEAINLSNIYAPEHLIVNVKNAERYRGKITNAGSVFWGNLSAESIGDYASGTNHSLPTYGYARSFGGISVESFMKSVTFQKVSKKGLQNIASTVIKMASLEKLDAHANAINVRLKNEN